MCDHALKRSLIRVAIAIEETVAAQPIHTSLQFKEVGRDRYSLRCVLLFNFYSSFADYSF